MPSKEKRPRWIVGGIVAVVVVLGIAIATRPDTSKTSAAARPQPTASGASDKSTTNVLDDAGLATAELNTLTDKSVGGVSGADRIPLHVAVSDTTALADGDPVGIHVTAEKDSKVYGFEAFLCRSGESYVHDADIRPTQTGKCAKEALSAKADQYLEVKADPPYDAADGVFHVGVGSRSFTTTYGQASTVTCDATHPCVVVLKVQFPNGFGFELIPVSFR